MPFLDFYRNRRVLIAGHTGFKGSRLALWLKVLRAEVAGFGLPPETEPNLFGLADTARGMTHVVGDILDFDALLTLISDFEPEIVFHLAGHSGGSSAESEADPRSMFAVNVQGTVNLLEAARRCPTIRAIAVATGADCYENQGWFYGYRENDAVGGGDPFSASKGAAESAVRAYARSYFSSDGPRPVGVATLRAGNLIGGGDFSVGRLIPDAVRAALSGVPLAVRSPETVRPWQFVLEALAGYLSLGVRLCESPKRFSGPWNFGPAESGAVPVFELVESFFEHFDNAGWTDVSGTTEAGVSQRPEVIRLSTDKARHRLGFRGLLTTAEAAATTAEWYRRVLVEKMDPVKLCLKDIGEYVERAARAEAWWAV